MGQGQVQTYWAAGSKASVMDTGWVCICLWMPLPSLSLACSLASFLGVLPPPGCTVWLVLCPHDLIPEEPGSSGTFHCLALLPKVNHSQYSGVTANLGLLIPAQMTLLVCLSCCSPTVFLPEVVLSASSSSLQPDGCWSSVLSMHLLTCLEIWPLW